MQGTAADLIKIAMIRIQKWISKNGMNMKIIMQVHDELVFELEQKDIVKYGNKICSLMSNAENLNVPLVVNTFSGSNWQES